MMDAAERSFVYEMFAGLYSKEPSPNELAAFLLFARGYASQFPSEASLKLAEMITEQHEKVVMTKDESWLAELRQAYYDHLFVSSSGTYVPPYESAVMSKTLWGQEAIHCASCYEALDFDPTRLNVFPPLREIALPDHVGYQLAFMAFLAKRESQCEAGTEVESWRGLQVEFCRHHLASWLPVYSEAVERCGLPFYRSLATVVAQFVCDDLADLENREMRGEWN